MIDKLRVVNPSDPERPSIFRLPDGRVGYRASEMGRCIRALVLARLGYLPEPPDEQSLRVMEMGNVHEPWAARWWVKENGGILQRQVRIGLNAGTGAALTGVSDGLWFPNPDDVDKTLFRVVKTGSEFDPEVIEYLHPYHPGSDITAYGLEIKAPGDSMFTEMSKNGPSDGYKMQLSIYWHAYEEILGIELAGFVFILRRRNDGLHHVQIIHEPYYTRKQIVDRILQVEELAKLGTYENVDCDKTDWYCKFYKYHKKDSNSMTTPSGAIYDPTLKPLAEEYSGISSKIRELEERQKHLKTEIDLAMKGRDKVRTDGFTCYYSSRTHVNEMSLLYENPDMKDKYTKFDLAACIADNPDFEKRYTVSGAPFLTVRALPTRNENGAVVKKEKPIQMERNPDPQTVLDNLLLHNASHEDLLIGD